MGPKLINLTTDQRLLVIGGIILLVLLFRAGQIFLSRKKTINLPLGAARDYGIAGGAICPKCHRPFSLSLVDIKIGFGSKLTRCPYCGKWSVLHRLSIEELRAAEAAELADAQPSQPVHEKSEADKLKEMAEESRFTDKE